MLIAIVFIILSISAEVSSHTITITGDDWAGWKINSSFHMSSMYTTYNFAVGAEDLETAFNSGKSIWGSYISMTKTSSNPKGTITDFDDSGDGAIARTYSGTYWTITVNRYWYDTLANKSIVWAHEIGHVYGLTHVTTATNYLMYPVYSSSMYLHNYEKLGMENCTAAHISHNTSSYTDYDNTNHKVRCSVCRGYHYLEAHSYIEDPDICDYCGHDR